MCNPAARWGILAPMHLLLLLLALLAPARAADGEARATEPVLEYARRDVRAFRVSQLAFIASVVGPGVYFAGGVAVGSFAPETNGTGFAAGVALTATGATASLAGPPLLAWSAGRSRRALLAQGLSPKRAGNYAAVPLWAASVVTLGAASAIAGSNVDEAKGAVVAVVGTYTGAVFLSAAQLRANHIARRDAGWLAVVPSLAEGRPVLALAGTF